MESLLIDARQGLRLIFKNRVVSLATILTLALGIGANTAIFSTVDALVLRPFDFPDMDRLVSVAETFAYDNFETNSVAPADYLDLKAQNTTLEGLAAYDFWDSSLTGDGDPERVQGARVAPHFFTTIGVKPLLGRTFSDDEERPGHEHVIVLSNALWMRRYAGDPSVIGRSILVNGDPFTVIGVMPPSFKFPQPTLLWAPITLTNDFISDRTHQYLFTAARLKPGVSLDQAKTELAALTATLEKEYPTTNKNRTSRVRRLRDIASGEFTPVFLMTLMAAVMFVLMIAAVNVANIQLARANGRKKEMALRAALGATRSRVIRQLLTESIVLSLIGGAAGILTAIILIDFIRASIPPDVIKYLAGWDYLTINGRTLLFTFVVAVATGVLFGLAPAYQASKPDLNETLKEGGRSPDSAGRHRLRSLLVIGEVALALTLLIGAGLMIRGFNRVAKPEGKGFNADNVLTMHLRLNERRYTTPERMRAFYKEAIEKMSAIPGARSAFAMQNIPDGGSWNTEEVTIEGRPAPPPGEDRTVNFQTITPGYFQALQISMIDGRDFSELDDAGKQRVAIVSSQFLRKYFPDENPIGKRIKVPADSSEWITIVGVVADVRRFMFDRSAVQTVYLPLYQAPVRSMLVAARTSQDPDNLASAARSAIYAIDSDQPVYDVKAANTVIDEQYSGLRLAANLMLIFGAIALGLAALGVYAVMSYSVQQRTHEIGVRMALGASQVGVLKGILVNALLLSGAGLLIGLPVAYALSNLMANLLGTMIAIDAITFIAFAVLLVVVSLLATFVPARRASKVDPMIALRCE